MLAREVEIGCDNPLFVNCFWLPGSDGDVNGGDNGQLYRGQITYYSLVIQVASCNVVIHVSNLVTRLVVAVGM